ncbi:zinc-dependent peptidase [Ectothiorhodospira sp. PHS-1]|uniref:M90 family metallopeptidase n=1 Tax=Ectothiorhodospira sp. PHS-1 TaxID=519989 RepID=UPI001FEF6413|nr:M90 family metallopeptidase [Ectothiorhodospira sp. PHS-1]
MAENFSVTRHNAPIRPDLAQPRMIPLFKSWRRHRTLARAPIPDSLWHAGLAAQPMLIGFNGAERAELRRLATLFLDEKHLHGTHGLEITPAMALHIALQACLPILRLGIDWYDQWSTIIVYPDDFLPRREIMDDDGILHLDESPYSGEAWERGPVLLSWAAMAAGEPLAIHEFVHTLDLRNGVANGMPPLHPEMSIQDWTRAMSRAYDELHARLDRDEPVELDPYAASDPGEFFAVMSEYFFAEPWTLAQSCPDVYGQFRQFYRQDPLARLPRGPDILDVKE